MLKISSANPITEEKLLKHRLYVSKVLQTPRASIIIVYWLLGFLGVFLITLFLPWQQNIRAEGKVTALRPQDRPQSIASAIAGRIEQWQVREGQFVKQGDTILVLSEVKDKFFDPKLLDRINEQLAAKDQGMSATRDKIAALTTQIEALESGMQLSLQKAGNKIKQSQLKVISDSTDYEAEKFNNQIAKRQLDAQQELYEKGLKSLTELEARRLKFQESSAKLISVHNKFLASKNELLNARIELSSLRMEYADKISKARSDHSSARSYLADATSELSKLTNEYSNMRIRNEQYVIKAPQDGYVIKALKAGIGEIIKEGDGVVTIMPANPAVAVELYIKAMDVPLLSLGRHVRLQFDGWPALQFSGWPSVSVGTFGGEIAVIDYVNSKEKEGKYRILVVPDETDEPWPMQLRQGSGVHGWAMLDDVPIWYELWRQLNGFPPSLQSPPDELYFGSADDMKSAGKEK